MYPLYEGREEMPLRSIENKERENLGFLSLFT